MESGMQQESFWWLQKKEANIAEILFTLCMLQYWTHKESEIGK